MSTDIPKRPITHLHVVEKSGCLRISVEADDEANREPIVSFGGRLVGPLSFVLRTLQEADINIRRRRAVPDLPLPTDDCAITPLEPELSGKARTDRVYILPAGLCDVSESSFEAPASDNARLEGIADGAALVCLFGAVPHALFGGDIGLAATVITTSVIVVAVRYRIGARALLRLTMPLGQHKPDKTAEEHRHADDLHRNPER